MNAKQRTETRHTGHAADFLPWSPTPFTWSMFQAGWEAAVQHLASELEVSSAAPVWTLKDGQVFETEAFWRSLLPALTHPGDVSVQVLGISANGISTPPARRRGWFGFLRRRPADPWQRHQAAVEAGVRRVQRWARRVGEARWTQADLLQVMEEIAPHLGDILSAWVITTLALADAAEEEGISDMAWPELVRGTDTAPRRLLAELGALYDALAHEATPDSFPSEPPQALTSFLHRYPWLSTQPFEAATPRWLEDPTPLWVHMQERVRLGLPISRPTGEASIRGERTARWLALREAVRVAVTQVVTAARVWVLAAAQEALADGRLSSTEEAFFLTLEELKQMMTGEWNRAEQVQPHVASRRKEYARSGNPVPDRIPVPSGSVVAARGWQPGWSLAAPGGRELVTTHASSLSYGHLLAYLLGMTVRVEGEV